MNLALELQVRIPAGVEDELREWIAADDLPQAAADKLFDLLASMLREVDRTFIEIERLLPARRLYLERRAQVHAAAERRRIEFEQEQKRRLDEYDEHLAHIDYAHALAGRLKLYLESEGTQIVRPDPESVSRPKVAGSIWDQENVIDHRDPAPRAVKRPPVLVDELDIAGEHFAAYSTSRVHRFQPPMIGPGERPVSPMMRNGRKLYRVDGCEGTLAHVTAWLEAAARQDDFGPATSRLSELSDARGAAR